MVRAATQILEVLEANAVRQKEVNRIARENAATMGPAEPSVVGRVNTDTQKAPSPIADNKR